jgi:exodeoxyribonuclease X
MIPQETLGAIIVDTETTDIKDPEVIEMAWVEIADVSFERVENIDCDRFKPTKPITLGAIATHHILPSDLTYCQPFDLAYLPKSTYLIVQIRFPGGLPRAVQSKSILCPIR